MNLQDFAEFVLMFKLPLVVIAVCVSAAAIGWLLGDDGDRLDWPREDHR